MTKDGLFTPRDLLARGSVSAERMEQLLNRLRRQREELATQFPNATFVMDAEDVLRIEASETDAGEIDYRLQESLTAFTPFTITIRQ
jgi:hypothetical protein